jgi:putative alpha-1,2-mannosidase
MRLRSTPPSRGLAGLLLFLSLNPTTAIQDDLSQYVNPLMGSEGPEPGTGFGGGDIFVGGTLPFGVAKVGIDSTAANWSTAVLNGGWTPDGNVTGISMMHESGTGGSPKYGLISQMPLTSVDMPVNVLDNLTYSQPRVCLFLFGLTGINLLTKLTLGSYVGWQ